MTATTFSVQLMEIRRQQRLSQDALAKQMLVSPGEILMWEQGTAMPNLEQLIQLSRVLGVSLDELVLDRQPQPVAAEGHNQIYKWVGICRPVLVVNFCHWWDARMVDQHSYEIMIVE